MAVKSYIASRDNASKKIIDQYLKSWGSLYEDLQTIAPKAPLTAPVMPYAKRVSDLSKLLMPGLESGKLSEGELDDIMSLLEIKEDPSLNLDVELAITNEMSDLAKFLAQ